MTAPGSEAATVARDALALAVTSARQPRRRPERNPLLGRPTRRLTPRELDVLAAMARTGLRKAAAQQLGIKDQTCHNYLASAYGKLGADGAINAFRILGWLQIPDSPADVRYPVALLKLAERTLEDLREAADELRKRIAIAERAA